MDQHHHPTRPVSPAALPTGDRDHWLTTEASGREVFRSLIEQWLDRNGWSLAVTSRLAELALLAQADEPVPDWAAGMPLKPGAWVNHRGHAWEAIGTPASEPGEGAPGWRDVSLTSRLHSSGLNLFLRRKTRSLTSTFFLELGRLNEWLADVQDGKHAAPADKRLREAVVSAHVLGDLKGAFGPEELLSIAIGRLIPEPLSRGLGGQPEQRSQKCISGRVLRKACIDAGLDIVEDWAQIAELYPGKEPHRQEHLRQVLLGAAVWEPAQLKDELLATQVLLQRLEDKTAAAAMAPEAAAVVTID
jgi:hypothetical protein